MTRGRFLVVDDEEDMRGMLCFHFAGEGFAVDAVEDGVSGLAALAAAPYDVVLLDVHLPRMSGPVVLQEIRRRWPTQLVVMLSSGIEEDGDMPWWTALADGCLDKPFPIGELERLLEALLHRKAQGATTP
jgi:DNA-binding response OmpR family regulator